MVHLRQRNHEAYGADGRYKPQAGARPSLLAVGVRIKACCRPISTLRGQHQVAKVVSRG